MAESVRFDDIIATIMAEAERDPGARAIAWHQIIDRLAQDGSSGRDGDDDSQRRSWIATLAAWRDAIPLERRAMIAASMSGRRVQPDVIMLFAQERPSIAAPLIASVMPATGDWDALIPTLPAAVRALLRHREDLSPEAQRALDQFGAADLILAAPGGTISEQAGRSAPTISDLVERIEAFRSAKSHSPAPVAQPAPVTAEVQDFLFETGHDGVINWVDGQGKAAIIGLSLSQIADPGLAGVDGQAAGAFRRRSAFRNARMVVAGRGGAAGEWRISAVPFFAAADGRFCGYRGSARRPRTEEQAESGNRADQGALGLPGESLRQLTHELRTPLNAIMGFSEMIERQMLGPASQNYRESAENIHREARRLMVAVEDLDIAARLQSGGIARDAGDGGMSRDLAAMVAAVRDRHQHLLAERNADLSIVDTGMIHEVAIRPAALDRLLIRLSGALLALAEPGEMLVVHIGWSNTDRDLAAISIARPRAIADTPERDLLDPRYGPEGDWPDAPLLGLGFSLRLIRNMIHGEGGDLAIERDRISLLLPVASLGQRANNETGPTA